MPGSAQPEFDDARLRRLCDVGIETRLQRPLDVFGLRIAADRHEPDRAGRAQRLTAFANS